MQSPVIDPMLATTGQLPADLAGWAVEVKWDGMRVGCYLDGAGGLRLLSRNGNDATARYPELAELLDLLPGRAAILDGEVVALDGGHPSFGRLQERMTLTRPAAILAAQHEVPVTLLLFDVLQLDGRDLMGLPYRERREALESLGVAGERVVVPPTWPGPMAGEALRWTGEQGLEGVIAKRLGSVYVPGARSKDWIKVKHTRTLDVIVGGWVPAGRSMKALLLCVPEPDGLRYVGRVGTGFTEAERRRLAGLLDTLAADASPFTTGPDSTTAVRWVRPELTAEVEYLEHTQAGHLRHPVWHGLRGKHGA